ncbi:MAG TPA: hypothetical protein VFA54_16950 [Bryobacterales bacterium]|jgi:uncharacterized membrane protein|nr:hypothetical protein [Bryobacterales bacterium]
MHLAFIYNGVFIAIIAHGLIGGSLIWDKILLRRPETRNLLSYVFWLGALSILGLCLIPFGFTMPPIPIALVSFGAGLLHMASIFFYYEALKRGEASQTLAIMGGFSPLATALIGAPILAQPLGNQLLGFALLTAGGFVMFFSERIDLKSIVPPILLASGLFGLVNVLIKVVYDHTNFVSGYVGFTLGTAAGAFFLLVRRSWRKQIFEQSEEASPRSRFWYLVNRFLSGIGSFLVYYAVSLAHPAVVDAIAGVRYAIIFIGAFLITRLKPSWLAEDFSGRALAGKIAGTALVTAGLVLLGLQGGETNAVYLRRPDVVAWFQSRWA